MIANYFHRLYDIDDVEAFALLDNTNRIVDGWIRSKYDSTIFTEIGDSYLQIFGMDEELGFNVDEIVVFFDRGLIFVRNHARFLLMVIASPSVDVSYLRLAMNVSFSELEESRKARKMLKKLPLEKPFGFPDSQLDEFDDNERLLIERIMENRNAAGRTE